MALQQSMALSRYLNIVIFLSPIHFYAIRKNKEVCIYHYSCISFPYLYKVWCENVSFLLIIFQQQFPPFWPEGRHPKKYGPVFTIDHVSHNHYTNIKTWIFRINKKVKFEMYFLILLSLLTECNVMNYT